MARKLSVDAICRLIDALLVKGYPTVGEIAQLLGVSSRTLQRLLNEQQISYADLVERCRRTAACDSLDNTRDSIKDIAAALGYRDASSFSRAFRRWTGAAPRDFRKKSPGRQRDTSGQSGAGVKAVE